MKKIYQIPVTIVVKLKVTTPMLAESLSYGGMTNETYGNLSRENDGDLWDDEE